MSTTEEPAQAAEKQGRTRRVSRTVGPAPAAAPEPPVAVSIISPVKEEGSDSTFVAQRQRKMSRFDPSMKKAGKPTDNPASMWKRAARFSLSTGGMSDIQPHRPQVPRFENTYRLEPKEGERFKPDPVRKMMEAAMKSAADGQTYNPEECSDLAKCLSDDIKLKLKLMHYPRYKFIVWVVVAQNHGQNVLCGSSALAHREFDNFASASYKNSSVIVTAVAYGMYYE